MPLLLLALLAAAPDPSARVVRQAQRLAGQRYPRPSQVSNPRPGTFGDGLVPNLVSLDASRIAYEKLSKEVKNACRDAAAGVGAMPAPCREAMRQNQAAERAILTATHAAEAGMPPGLRALSDPRSPLQENGWGLLLQAARLATFDMAREVGETRPDMAVDLCVDVEALARDAQYGSGLLGMAVGASIQHLALRPCARAIDAASKDRKRLALEQLKTIRVALPLLSQTLSQEQVYTVLAAYGQLLDTDDRGMLPKEAEAIVAANTARYSVVERALLHRSRLDYLDYMDALIAAADLAPKARAARFAAAREKMSKSLNPLSKVAAPDMDAFAQRRDRGVASLEVLIEATRADLERKGDWPLPADPGRQKLTVLDPQHAKVLALVPGDEISVTITKDP